MIGKINDKVRERSKNSFHFNAINAQKYKNKYFNTIKKIGKKSTIPLFSSKEKRKSVILPKSENKKGDHPDRVYFFPSDVSYEDGRRLGQSICYSNKDQRNDGRYVLLFIETKDLKGISFCYDPHTQQSYYTTQTIPPEVIQLVGGYDYSKHKQFNVI
jgi:hypothetical protein